MKIGAVAAVIALLAGGAWHSLYADALLSPGDFDQPAITEEPTDAEIRDLLVKESIARHTGPCACPYHRKWNERLFWFPTKFRRRPTVRCGDYSEYVRPGGPTVLCFGSDVPADLVEAYRERLRTTFLTEQLPQF